MGTSSVNSLLYLEKRECYMKILLTAAILTLFEMSFCQSLLPQAVRVKKAYEMHLQDTAASTGKMGYVTAFPSNSEVFLKVFNPKTFDQLYSVSYNYIDALQQCAASYPKEVISKCVDIGKELTWNADAVGYLQKASVTLAAKYPGLFVDKYKRLHENEKKKLIGFYADVENHSAYPEYQELIDSVKRIGSTAIAKRLETARVEREKVKNH